MAGRAGCWAIKPIIPACPWGPHIKRLPHYVSISADHPSNAVLPTESSGLQLPGPTWCQGSIQTWTATLCLYRHSRPPPPPPSPGGSGPELTLTCQRGDIALHPWQAQDQKKSKEGYHFQRCLDMRNKQDHLVRPVAPQLDLTPVGLAPFRALPSGHWGRPSPPHPWARGWVWSLDAGGGAVTTTTKSPLSPGTPPLPGTLHSFTHAPANLLSKCSCCSSPKAVPGFPNP